MNRQYSAPIQFIRLSSRFFHWKGNVGVSVERLSQSQHHLETVVAVTVTSERTRSEQTFYIEHRNFNNEHVFTTADNRYRLVIRSAL